ncbi:DEAD/DEAH box helicase [Exilibacterium tricleocarpae]|uniref:ATP-dependent RNA helicase DeaD n=1 Tax=Exilibacterium tricleocarpae TaxID=2591008 RepID=A0A545SYU2_9GAMM|nr:DEAD/DEAH box helicase [Exilibacterium tricleocarpae]TQV70118.1 DEAD/DEAH box helicase [Exilibacterium tricleocarpae]
MNNTETVAIGFDALGLADALLPALRKIGYEMPSPIQARTIPPLLAGRDLLGQAQTGTGKTAAFALPLLSKIDIADPATQGLILAPTRELAIQVAEACQSYASHMRDFHVVPIYGGADYRGQIKQLRRGAQLVVGTPGRVMDHMRRGTLDLSRIRHLVLDEADEMLRMGFIDDVEWILEQTPAQRQTALFSATMPSAIKRIAKAHLREPEEITIKVKTATTERIAQRYWTVTGVNKLDALTRILEAEDFDAVIIFVRTKIATQELAERLRARGYGAAPLNGDIAQSQREQTLNQLKAGKVDILVATDVAARGLDVDRITHVINYDIPYDTEAYIHRIGRTGRAGRNGEAILFVAPREKRLLRAIEKATNKSITPMSLPSTADINQKRIADFKQRITETVTSEQLDEFMPLIEDVVEEQQLNPLHVAAALALIAQDGTPLLLKELPARPKRTREDGDGRGGDNRRAPAERPLEKDMDRYRLDVGRDHGAKPGHIVGCIANEADLDSQYIGHIAIHDRYATVDLPKGMPKEILAILKKARVAGRPLNLRKWQAENPRAAAKPRARPKKKKTGEHSGERR